MNVKAMIEHAAADPWDGMPPVTNSRCTALAVMDELRGRRGFEFLHDLEKSQRIEIVDTLAEIIAGTKEPQPARGQEDGQRSTQAA